MAEKPIYKRYCRVCWYGGRCWRFALTGSFNSAANWGGILGVGVIGATLHYFGFAVAGTEDWRAIVALGLFYIAVAWVVIFFFRLVFVAPFVINREGQWHGNEFIYREPKLGFHAGM